MWWHRPQLPVARISCLNESRRNSCNVVGFLAIEPTMHWSKLTALKQFRVRQSLACGEAHILAGLNRRAQMGHCGCSTNPHPPNLANSNKISKMKKTSLDPMRSCIHSVPVRPGIPSGWSPVLNGRGPSGRKRAAVNVSQGGPPPPLRFVQISLD